MVDSGLPDQKTILLRARTVRLLVIRAATSKVRSKCSEATSRALDVSVSYLTFLLDSGKQTHVFVMTDATAQGWIQREEIVLLIEAVPHG